MYQPLVYDTMKRSDRDMSGIPHVLLHEGRPQNWMIYTTSSGDRVVLQGLSGASSTKQDIQSQEASKKVAFIVEDGSSDDLWHKS